MDDLATRMARTMVTTLRRSTADGAASSYIEDVSREGNLTCVIIDGQFDLTAVARALIIDENAIAPPRRVAQRDQPLNSPDRLRFNKEDQDAMRAQRDPEFRRRWERPR